MAYAFGLLIFALIIYGIVKAVSGNRYAEMTDQEFEAEAKEASYLGPAIMTVQKIVDPNHHVEYVEEQKQRIEAEAAESGDSPGSPVHKLDYKIPH